VLDLGGGFLGFWGLGGIYPRDKMGEGGERSSDVRTIEMGEGGGKKQSCVLSKKDYSQDPFPKKALKPMVQTTPSKIKPPKNGGT